MSNVTPPQPKMNHNVPINQRRKFPRQQYKQLLIRFEKGTVVKYLYEQSIWNLMIENFFIANYSRQSLPRRIQETYIYKITGIPLNTDSRNIEPLITHTKVITLHAMHHTPSMQTKKIRSRKSSCKNRELFSNTTKKSRILQPHNPT